MKRTKIKNWLIITLCIIGMGTGLTACGGSDDGEGEKNFTEKLYGKKWIMDGNKKTTFRFFRNHLVECNSGTATSSGALTSGDAMFFGTWTATDNSLSTSFTSGTNGGFDWNSILYGKLTVKDAKNDNDRMLFTSPDGNEHEFLYVSSYSQNNTFTDYTDETAHDKALHGTWHATAYANNQAVEYTITVNKDGTVRWQQPDNDIDFTASYSTKNGHVTVDHVLVPNSDKASYIYIREDDRILFYTEDNAILEWSWRK